MIFLRFCTGYLNDYEFKKFLRKAKSNLKKRFEGKTENLRQKSYIIIQDNIGDLDHAKYDQYAQMVRTEENFKKVFEEAELTVSREAVAFDIGTNLCKVKMWALY